MKWVVLLVFLTAQESRYPDYTRERTDFSVFHAVSKCSATSSLGKLMCCHYTTAAKSQNRQRLIVYSAFGDIAIDSIQLHRFALTFTPKWRQVETDRSWQQNSISATTSHMPVVRVAIHSPPSPISRHGFRGHQKTALASVKHLRRVCFCGDENCTGMASPPELVGLIDYMPTLSQIPEAGAPTPRRTNVCQDAQRLKQDMYSHCQNRMAMSTLAFHPVIDPPGSASVS